MGVSATSKGIVINVTAGARDNKGQNKHRARISIALIRYR